MTETQPSAGDVTQALRAWANGEAGALDALLPLVVGELRILAAKQLRKLSQSNTMQPTALVNEAYLRLVRSRIHGFDSRAHFFSFASGLIRGILVDHARMRMTQKRNSGARVTLEDAQLSLLEVEPDVEMLLSVHEALARLELLDAGQARVVELRYFGGLTIPETALVLGIGRATVERRWRLARRWLVRELSRCGRPSPRLR